MEGIQPPKAHDEARTGFAAAVAGTEEAPAAQEATETAAGSSPSTPADESADVAAPQEVADDTSAPAVEETAPVETEETNKGPVPYDRFKQVNDAKNKLEADLKAAREGGRNVDPAVLEQLTQDRTRAMLAQIATQHPELHKVIYGEPEADPSTAGLDPKDPVHARLIKLESAQRQQTNSLQMLGRQKLLDDMESRAEDHMAKNPIFSNPTLRKTAERLIAFGVTENPKLPVEAVVDDVAKTIREIQEATKAAYVQPKIAAVKKIAPGVGGGSAAPPGKQNESKPAFGGSARKLLEAALRSENQAT